MELAFKDYQYDNQLLNFIIKEDEINGITGKNKEILADIISLKKNIKGKIIINNQELTRKNLLYYQRKINVVSEELEYAFFTETVYQLMSYEIRRKKLILKDSEKKIRDSLKIVDLNLNILERNIHSLSNSEKKLLQLAISLLSNPDVIILHEPFKYFDMKTEKRVMILLQKIKEQYQKTIVIVSDNTNMLYKYTTNLLIFKQSKILISGKTTDIFQRIDFLKRNNVDIPQIVEFTYIAKRKKEIKLDYHKDIRDIIKDIYKHV